MIRILGTILAGLLGLAFGSFLNVCLSRWPAGESVVKPRSHCRSCGRTLAWWENVPLVSWIFLRGRCRTCHEKISWRYPLVELAVAALWVMAWLRFGYGEIDFLLPSSFVLAIGTALLLTILLGLAFLDAEHLWLPDVVTLPGIAAGIIFRAAVEYFRFIFDAARRPLHAVEVAVLDAALAAALILLIRWTYWLIRRREGIGLGDAKLMALLGAWLGFSGALLSFAIGVFLGALFALVLLGVPRAWRGSDRWHLARLPLGTFLCIGGMISALWGVPIIAAYLRWVGL